MIKATENFKVSYLNNNRPEHLYPLRLNNESILELLTDYQIRYDDEICKYKIRLPYEIWRNLKNCNYTEFLPYKNWDGTESFKIIVTIEPNEFTYHIDLKEGGFGEYLCDHWWWLRSVAEIVDIDEEEINKELQKDNNRKDNDFMNFNFDFGPCTNDNVRMSIYGLAVKNSDGVWVSYDRNGKQIMDVDIFNFDGRKFMYKIPVAVKDIAVGDVVVHKRVPMFVESVENGIHVVDIFAGEKRNILPTSNMFGFNFVTKIVSVVDMGNVNANENNPFGNMLPFMLFADGDKNNKDFDPLMLMMLMNGGNIGDFSKNPLMMYALFGADNKDMLLPLMLMNNGNFTLPQPTPKVENPEG